MTTPTDLKALKRRLSGPLRAIPGVSGIGIPAGTLTIYLLEDADSVRKEVADLLAGEAYSAPVAFVVTGKFQPQG